MHRLLCRSGGCVRSARHWAAAGSATNWVLDRHKEKTPRDPTIRERFNTYRFADYKERMIALLAKVVRVRVETAAITEAMRAVERAEGS